MEEVGNQEEEQQLQGELAAMVGQPRNGDLEAMGEGQRSGDQCDGALWGELGGVEEEADGRPGEGER